MKLARVVTPDNRPVTYPIWPRPLSNESANESAVALFRTFLHGEVDISLAASKVAGGCLASL